MDSSWHVFGIVYLYILCSCFFVFFCFFPVFGSLYCFFIRFFIVSCSSILFVVQHKFKDVFIICTSLSSTSTGRNSHCD